MNYFIELNPNYSDVGFDYRKANAVDGKSKPLIENMKLFLTTQLDKYGISFEKCDIEIVCETYGLQVDRNRLTCDYLGPSTYYAEQKISNVDILKYIIDTRVFGGHMIWPSSLIKIGRFDDRDEEISKSINTARSYCLRERLDYTLFELREWYVNGGNNGTPIFQMVLDGNRTWFEKYGNGEDGYRTFLDVFALNDIVSPNSFEPYDFESFNGSNYDKTIQKKKKYVNEYIPQDRKNYINYINGTVAALIKRNERIKNANNMFKDF